MNRKTFRIATRKSLLALCQANYIKQKLEALHPDMVFEFVPLVTEGDQQLSVKLADVGGKGLFVKELEEALLADQADMAVHSMKDVPMHLPKGLEIPVICEREDPRDAFISNHYVSLDLLPEGGTVGTSSLRRQCQIKQFYRQVKMENLRGNVDSRLRKLDENQVDGIILAVAGLNRLGLQERISSFLPIEYFIPAVGQGALGIECREGDDLVMDLIRPLHHQPTADCVTAERTMNERLDGGCHAPIAAYARFEEGDLVVRGMVADPATGAYIEAKVKGSDPVKLGMELAERLLGEGAGDVLKGILL